MYPFGLSCALRARGCEVILLHMPSNGRDSAEAFLKQTPFPLACIDLDAHLQAIGYMPHYSDGLHLDPPTAQEVSALLARFLRVLSSHCFLPER